MGARFLVVLFAGWLGPFFLHGKEENSGAASGIRWAAEFQETYRCRATGQAIGFSVRTPPRVEGRDRYPMIVVLKGGPRTKPSEDLPYFQIKPTGGGIWGYRSMSAVDALQAIDHMKRHYPIDPDQVSLVGFSAGGSGAMHLASLHPNEFSAVVAMVAAGNDYPMAPFRNLPVAFHHGDRDWTSSICDARVQFQKMKEAGCPVILKEYPGAGHSIPGSHEPIVSWMLEQVRYSGNREAAGADFLEGAAWNLYRGEPMLVVVGTGGEDSARKAQLRAAAEILSRCGGPRFGLMKHTRFPVIEDVALTSQQEKQANLLLVGTPEENAVAARLLSGGPLDIEAGVLRGVGNRELALDGQVVSLGLTHPTHPDRFAYFLMPWLQTLEGFAANPHGFLVGADGFHPEGQPELRIQDGEFRIALERQLGREREWLAETGDASHVPESFRDREGVARAYLVEMQRQSGADFAAWWGPEDEGLWGTDFNFLFAYQPRHYRLSDFRAHRRPAETMLGTVSGADLKEIGERWIESDEILVHPDPEWERIDDEAAYRIHLPMDLYLKLGQRKKNLENPRPGPVITREQIARSIAP